MEVSAGAAVTRVEVPYGWVEWVRVFRIGILAILITVFLALGNEPSGAPDAHYPDSTNPPEFNAATLTAAADITITFTPKTRADN